MALDKSQFFKVMADQGLALTYDDVRLETGHSDVGAQAADTASRFSKNIGLKTPLLSAAMDTVTTSEMAIALARWGGLGVIHAGLTPDEQLQEVQKVKNAPVDDLDKSNVDDQGQLRTAAAVSTDESALERLALLKGNLDVVVIDTAQGDSDYAFSTLAKIKEAYPDIDVVVGNISSAASARELAEAGADGLKVGQGPGSICTTRTETGIGAPQVTAVFECVQAVKDFDIPICADGGITNPGDISIAIAAGASSVMIGGGFAGTDESPGEVITDNGRQVKFYRGMGSPSAMRDSAASRKRYGADTTQGRPLSEGVESHVPYQGSVEDILDRYLKALRKSMSYVGSHSIASHQEKARFFRITNAGLRESHPHDVKVI